MEFPKIQELAGDVVNKIAAGEVVERPAQLVKELIENSLDAGATEITVDAKDGGRWIQVIDDGIGIAKNDLKIALARHTTSKITQVDDLWKLQSFGFRGEALASIASVARLTLTSRRKDQESGATLVCEFGDLSKVEAVSSPVGTTVQVRDLFENVPARLKFLKSSGAEITAIRQVLKGLALANSKVTFRFRIDGELEFFFAGVDSKLERAQQVLDIDNLFAAELDSGDASVFIAFADGKNTMKTSKNIWLFAQNRWIQDRGIQAAVTEAYRGTLMHGEYPIAVVWLQVAPDEIDVNIHPTKSQVKFRDNQKVFRLVHHSLRAALEKHHGAKNVAYVPPTPTTSLRFESPDFQRTSYQQKPTLNDLARARETRSAVAAPAVQSSTQIASSLANIITDVVAPQVLQATTEKWSSLQVLAQAHLTYIIAQKENELILIDQHAAHERVLFETVMQGWKSGQLPRQDHLFPTVVDLTPDKVEALLRCQADFEKLGLRLEAMGPSSIGISSTPAFLNESVLPKLLDQVATEALEHGGSYSFERHLHDIAATIACHSAIRAGQALSLEEMQALLKQMDEFSFSQFCPHGRPVSVEWSLASIEKSFGRRV